MNKREFSAKLLLCFLMMLFLMVIGCGKNNGTSTAAITAITATTATFDVLPAYTQGDLTGTWHANMLKTGSSNGWMRAIVTIDSAGVLTFSSCLDSDDNTKCPTGPIQWTINESGVISESDNGTATDFHYTMTSAKNLIAGTGTSDSGIYQLSVLQKDAGRVYDSSEIAENFVYHSFMVGSNLTYGRGWAYGTGVIDADGAAIISSQTTPSGTTNPGRNVTFTLASNGDVSLSGAGLNNFKGFLSSDGMVIVGTATSEDGIYSIWFAQRYTEGFDHASLVGTSFNHILATGIDPAAVWAYLWAHQTININSEGVMSFSDWVTSNVSLTGPSYTPTISINSTGTATINGSDFHGQCSVDGKFMIGTQKLGTDSYSLMVFTR